MNLERWNDFKRDPRKESGNLTNPKEALFSKPAALVPEERGKHESLKWGLSAQPACSLSASFDEAMPYTRLLGLSGWSSIVQ